MNDLSRKIALGTVQFGLPYGINNTRGQVPTREVERILERAFESGIDTLDTATAYGESEKVLGSILSEHDSTFRVVSKLPADALDVDGAFAASLKHLRVPRLYGYLFHNITTFDRNPSLWERFLSLRERGLVERIGFSLYYPEEAERLLDLGLDLSLVQVPYSILDRRFDRIFPYLVDRGIEIHVRSIFLQGIFFRNPIALEPFFDPIKAHLLKLHRFSEEHEIPMNQLCLGFALSNHFIDRVVIGVDSLQNLEENLHCDRWIDLCVKMKPVLDEFCMQDTKFLLPFNWKL